MWEPWDDVLYSEEKQCGNPGMLCCIVRGNSVGSKEKYLTCVSGALVYAWTEHVYHEHILFYSYAVLQHLMSPDFWTLVAHVYRLGYRE